MKNNPPEGFKTWIQFHDYLDAQNPKLLKARSLRFATRSPIYDENTEVRIDTRTIFINCWKEIQEERLTMEEWHKLPLLYSETKPELLEKYWRFVEIIGKLPLP